MDEGPPPDFATHFLEGVELFNGGRFWHAHEAWEKLWLVEREETRPFLQGLIQLAAAYHHLQRGTLSGAVRLFDSALVKLAPYPSFFCGVDRDALVTAADHHRHTTSLQLGKGGPGKGATDSGVTDFPRIRLTTDWRSRLPPLPAQ